MNGMPRAEWVERFYTELARLTALDVAAARCPKCGAGHLDPVGRYRRCSKCTQVVTMRIEVLTIDLGDRVWPVACAIPRDEHGGSPELAARNERALCRFVVEATTDPIPEYLAE